MKKYLPLIVISITCCSILLSALITNRTQKACVDYGDLHATAESPRKVSFEVTEMEKGKEAESVYREIYASTGSLMALSTLNFGLLTAVLLYVSAKKKL